MKTKSLLKTIGFLVAGLIPTITIIACSSSSKAIEKYDTTNDGEIILKTSWSKSGNQYKLLEKIVETYNKQVSKSKGEMPVKMISTTGGYGVSAKELTTDIAVGKKDGMPNILIEYPDAAGIIGAYKFSLDMTKTSTKIDTSLIESKFLDENKRIGGLSKDGIYFVPIGKSTEMMSINKPLFKKIIDELEKNGATIESSASKVKAIKGESFNEDLSSWKPKKVDNKGYKISDEIFTNWDKLFEFSNRASKLFGLDVTENNFILGIDDLTNFMYLYNFANNNHNYNDFLFVKNSKGYIDYKLFEKSSKQHRDFKEQLNKIIDLVRNGALKIGGGGNFTSSSLIEHEAAITIGSTAGYIYNYYRNSAKHEVKNSDSSGKIEIVEKYRIKYDTRKKAFQMKPFNSSFWNNFVAKKNEASKGKYDIVIPDTLKLSIDSKIKSKDIAKGKEYIIFENNATNFHTDIKSLSDNFKYIDKDAGGYLRSIQDDEKLSENELQIYISPSKTDDSTNNKKTLFPQGPSFVGVHANEAENAATVKFINWFYENKAEDFSQNSGYITPFKDFKSSSLNFKNKGTKLAFDEFKNNDYTFFNQPIDRYSSILRKNVFDAPFRSIYTTFHSSSSENFDDVYKKLESAAKTQRVIV